jgi:hypothetical protein
MIAWMNGYRDVSCMLSHAILSRVTSAFSFAHLTQHISHTPRHRPFLQALLSYIPWLLKTFDPRFIDQHVVTLLCNALDKQNSNLQVRY